MRHPSKQTGFTIVELLIVIVIIAVLAAITIVAYNGIQSRARDARRSSDITSILKMLEGYKALNNSYPVATSTAGVGQWEESTETAGTFMEYLQTTFSTKVPVDPVNNATHYYQYYRYSVSTLATYGCPTNRGNLMVFYAIGFDNAANMPPGDSTLTCTSNTWAAGGTTYLKYNYEK